MKIRPHGFTRAGWRLGAAAMSLSLTFGLVALGACGSNEAIPSDGAPNHAAPVPVGPEGGQLAAEGATIVIPPGALDREVYVSITASDDADGLAPLALEGRAVELRSKVYAFTPHGVSFSLPASVTLPYRGLATTVVRLSDADDTTWERVDGASFDGATARFEIGGFSFYAVVSEDPEGPGGGGHDPGGGDPPVQRSEGEFVIDIPETHSRVYHSTQYFSFDGTRMYWLESAAGKLSVYSASLSGAAPASATLLKQGAWSPDAGWEYPPLLVTDGHLIFPLIGTFEGKRGDGWASLRKDGTTFTQSFWTDGWWVASAGANVAMEHIGTNRVHSVHPETGAQSELPEDHPWRGAYAMCFYNGAVREIACESYGTLALYSYDTRVRRDYAAKFRDPDNGLTARVAFNATHYFGAVDLDGGEGIRAVARADGGTRDYPGLKVWGGFAADDTHLFLCFEGVLSRVALADGSRAVLTEDCGAYMGTSILGQDAKYVYYSRVDPESLSYPKLIHPDKISIYRISKAAVKKPAP